MTTALPTPSVTDVERRIQHLILGLSEGRLPVDADVDDLRGAVTALAREGGVPSWRLEEFGSAVRVLSRKVLPGGRHAAPTVRAPRRSTPSPGPSRVGHGFWRTNGQRVDRRHVPLRRRAADAPADEGSAHAAERARVADEAMQLRDRADRFAAAHAHGRRFPQLEAQRLLLQFKDLRGELDAETRSLNDVAVRRLIDAGTRAQRVT